MPPATSPDRALLARLLESDLAVLMAEARSLRDEGYGLLQSFSPKVFVPLTRLCRDYCHYCTFSRPLDHHEAPYLSLDEVLAIARAGQVQGCSEALFTLGDKPEFAPSGGAAGAVGARLPNNDRVSGRCLLPGLA